MQLLTGRLFFVLSQEKNIQFVPFKSLINAIQNMIFYINDAKLSNENNKQILFRFTKIYKKASPEKLSSTNPLR